LENRCEKKKVEVQTCSNDGVTSKGEGVDGESDRNEENVDRRL
jgi:hypothetical protein